MPHLMPPSNRKISVLACLSAIGLCIIFGANTAAIKISLMGLGKFTTAGLRFGLAAAAIALWARLTGRRFAIPRDNRKPLLLISIIFTVQIALFNLGLSRTYASRGALVVNAVPFLVLIFAHFCIPGDRINVRKLAGMTIGFGGVALVLADSRLVSNHLRSGDLVILGAATIWAVNAVYTKSVIDRFQPFHLVLYPMLFAIPLLFLAGWLWDGKMISLLDASIALAMIFQSLICAAFGFVAWNTLLQRYGASTLHSFIFIMPVAGVTAGAMILGEPLTRHVIAAVILIAAGIALVNFRRKPLTPVLPVGRAP